MILVASLLIGRIYEDEIRDYAIGGLNRQIRTQVDVDNIKLSLLKKFPDASLEFERVFVRSVPDFDYDDFNTNTDTLLYAEKLYLQFDVFKLLRNKYIVKEVDLQRGVLKVMTDREGGTNYELWKRETNDNSGIFLELDNVGLSGMRMEYLNRALEMESFVQIKKAALKGSFYKSEYRLNMDLQGLMTEHKKEGIIFIKQQEITSSASMV